MRLMKRHILTTLSLIIFLSGYGQSKLQFEQTTYDFGEIEEEGGAVEYAFTFVNTSDSPIRITGVKASCGCTTPGWTNTEVMPGDSGFVKAKYNPRNRPGRFRKSLKISTTDPTSNMTIYIAGFVKPKPKTPEQEFPITAGDLRLKYRGLNMGKITTEKTVTKTFEVYNASDSVVMLTDQVVSPSHIRLALSPEQIEGRQKGELIITYDPNEKNDYGFVSDDIRLGADDQGLSVMGIIEEYFPEMTAEELDKAPKLEISQKVFDFGSVKAGTVIETSFDLSNQGKEKLIFRAIKSNCACVTYETKNKGLKKGKTQTLKVSFDTSDLRGNQYKSLTIYSNDPVNPTQLITIRGKVEK